LKLREHAVSLEMCCTPGRVGPYALTLVAAARFAAATRVFVAVGGNLAAIILYNGSGYGASGF
jgi:hypothetical protein